MAQPVTGAPPARMAGGYAGVDTTGVEWNWFSPPARGSSRPPDQAEPQPHPPPVRVNRALTMCCHTLAAHHGVTCHVMVGFSDPAVRSRPPAQHLAAEGHLTPAPRLALDAGDVRG
jgi:hypothetical protein